jgi:hypothetical protein
MMVHDMQSTRVDNDNNDGTTLETTEP